MNSVTFLHKPGDFHHHRFAFNHAGTGNEEKGAPAARFKSAELHGVTSSSIKSGRGTMRTVTASG